MQCATAVCQHLLLKHILPWDTLCAFLGHEVTMEANSHLQGLLDCSSSQSCWQPCNRDEGSSTERAASRHQSRLPICSVLFRSHVQHFGAFPPNRRLLQFLSKACPIFRGWRVGDRPGISSQYLIVVTVLEETLWGLISPSRGVQRGRRKMELSEPVSAQSLVACSQLKMITLVTGASRGLRDQDCARALTTEFNQSKLHILLCT